MRTPALALVLTATLVVTAAATAHPDPGNSAATIAGSFSDGCRDFTARSSKDISHVKLRYVDGRVVKDETINTPDYSINGAAGDELDDVIVKSGTTWQRFKCTRTSGPPTAILEIQTPPLADCTYNTSEHPSCLSTDPRTVWSRPAGGVLGFVFVDPVGPESPSFRFRGTSSTDPDSDIASWSIDFGDGTSAGGSWATEPPAEITHTYPPFGGFNPFAVVTLTVTDSAGQSDSDTLSLVGIDGRPD